MINRLKLVARTNGLKKKTVFTRIDAIIALTVKQIPMPFLKKLKLAWAVFRNKNLVMEIVSNCTTLSSTMAEASLKIIAAELYYNGFETTIQEDITLDMLDKSKYCHIFQTNYIDIYYEIQDHSEVSNNTYAPSDYLQGLRDSYKTW